MAVKRIRNHGRWTWQARVAYRGIRRAAFRATREEARDAEAEMLGELKASAAQVEQDGAQPATLRQLLEFYVADLTARGKGEETTVRAESTVAAITRLCPELLAKPVSALGDRDIFAFRLARAQEGKTIVETIAGEPQERLVPRAKPSTINRDLRTLRAALKKALPGHRFPEGAFFPEDETRVRWLRPDEELTVLATLASPFREIATLAALTLMRLSEIRLLQRADVHLEQGVILLPRAKAGARPVMLSEAARKLLALQLAGHESAWAFPGPEGRPYRRDRIGKVFRKAARASGLQDFHFHDLRHHGATMALNRGFTAPIVMALGGWKTERMMRRYAAVTDATLRAAAEAVSGSEPWQQARKYAPAQAGA
ncbi:MAG: site-specific integrase [Candidatus Rokubacteria bacterium]|nr:site-specific integrase [Candidatus Rokubacteria bacterium]